MAELKVEDIPASIKKMKKAGKEMLLRMLSGEGKELSRRLKEVKSKKITTLTREETFKGV